MKDAMIGVEQNVGARVLRATAILTLALAVVFSASCKRKKKETVPPAATAPAISQPTDTPPPPPSATTTTTTGTTTPPATATTPKPKPKKKAVHKPKPQTPAQPPQQQTPAKPSGAITSPPSGTNGNSTGEPMSISPNLAPGDADAQKRQTEQLLQTAEGNLRKINRQLSDAEQGMVRQVRNYITQSRLATQDGDLERAHNLAVKAQLLSQELIK